MVSIDFYTRVTDCRKCCWDVWFLCILICSVFSLFQILPTVFLLPFQLLQSLLLFFRVFNSDMLEDFQLELYLGMEENKVLYKVLIQKLMWRRRRNRSGLRTHMWTRTAFTQNQINLFFFLMEESFVQFTLPTSWTLKKISIVKTEKVDKKWERKWRHKKK